MNMQELATEGPIAWDQRRAKRIATSFLRRRPTN
jgi:hypothetical protein